jgi:rhodanese-related sulfurtransferase
MAQRLSVLLLLLSGISLIYAGGSAERGVVEAEITDLSQLPKNKRGYAEIAAEQLHPLLDSKDFLLVNVIRSAGESIPQTDFTVPVDGIEDNLNQFSRKDQSMVLYCQAGGLSRSAVGDLVEFGFTNVVWLTGGINAWKRAGYEVEGQ